MWPKKLNKGSSKLLKIQTSEVHYGDRTGNFSSLDITKKPKEDIVIAFFTIMKTLTYTSELFPTENPC